MGIELARAFVSVRGDVTHLATDLRSAQPGIRSAVAEIVSSIGGIRNAFLGLAAIGAVFKAGQFEQTVIAFETMIGSVEETKKTLEDLTEFAAKTPFEMPEIESAARGLIQFGERGDELMKTLHMLGNAASGSSTPFGFLALVFNQVRGVGKLLTQDFRQLSTRGILSLADIAKYYGITTEAAQKMLSTGQISFEELKKILESLSAEGGRFHNLMERQSKSLLGLWSTLKDAMGITARTIGQELVPTAKEFVVVAIKIVEVVRTFVQEHSTLIRNLIRAVEIWVAYEVAVRGVTAAIKAYTVAIGALAGVKAFFTGAAAGAAGGLAGAAAGAAAGGVGRAAVGAAAGGAGRALAVKGGVDLAAEGARAAWYSKFISDWTANQTRAMANEGMAARALADIGSKTAARSVGARIVGIFSKAFWPALAAYIVGKVAAWGIESYFQGKLDAVEAENKKPSDDPASKAVFKQKAREDAARAAREEMFKKAAENEAAKRKATEERRAENTQKYNDLMGDLANKIQQVSGGYSDAEMQAWRLVNVMRISKDAAAEYLAEAQRLERLEAFRKVQNEIKELTESVKIGSMGLDEIQAKLYQLSQTEGVTPQQIAKMKMLLEMDRGNKSLEAAADRLKDVQRELFFLKNGFTDTEKEIYKFNEALGEDVAGDRLGNAQRARAKDAFVRMTAEKEAQEKAAKRREDQKKEGESIAESVMTPIEESQQRIKKAFAAFQRGDVTEDVFQRVVKQEQKKFATKKDWAFEGSVGVGDLGRRIQDALLKPKDKNLEEAKEQTKHLGNIEKVLEIIEKKGVGGLA